MDIGILVDIGVCCVIWYLGVICCCCNDIFWDLGDFLKRVFLIDFGVGWVMELLKCLFIVGFGVIFILEKLGIVVGSIDDVLYLGGVLWKREVLSEFGGNLILD